MRYLSAELIGYIGIYNGLGLNQIKIDFTKCMYNKIIIRGKNGSGKSTLMNAINPNPDSNDLFIPGVEARKNLLLLCNGIQYMIRYIHPVNPSNGSRGTTRGFIAKNINGQMIELNPNGNISSCKDILYEEFGLDANFVALSKLSSENRGLVDNRPAERKKLLNGIINTLEVFNNIYKVLSKKVSAYRQLINSLTYKIDHIGDETAIMGQLANIEARIEALEKDKEMAISASAAIKLKITEHENTLKDKNYDAIIAELKSLSIDVKYLQNNINKQLSTLGIEDMSKVAEFIQYINSKIVALQAEIDSYKGIIPGLLSQREVEFKDLQNKTERLNSLQSQYNYIDIKTAMNNARTIVDKYDEVFNRMGLSKADLITREEYESAMEALNYLLECVNILMANYDIHDIAEVINANMFTGAYQKILEENKRLLDGYKSSKFNLEKELAIVSAKREVASELVNRPKDCVIDSCPYIKSAVEADNKYPAEQLQILNSKIAAIDSDIDTAEQTRDLYEKYLGISLMLNDILKELKSKYKFIKKLPIRKDFDTTFFTRIANCDPFNDIAELYKYVDYSNILDEYRVAKEQLKTYEMEYKLYESKNVIIESLITDIEQLTSRVDELAQKIGSLNEQIASDEKELVELKAIKNKVELLSSKISDNLLPAQKRVQELMDIGNSLNSITVILKELHSNLSISDHNIGEIGSDIKKLSVERDKLKHSLDLLAEYKAELNEYNTKYIKIDKIRYYSSPSTGIQTLFMQLYMNKIITTANDLLSLLFDGEFVLQPFIINDSEFKIPCVGNGLMHDDISSMSTAQKSMISMILSFALLYQSSTKYNIISVDEIDGGLDTGNRLYMITLLDRLMMMLQCEQCFIVSHNTELDTSMADLIVLKSDSGESYNGNIIWHY